MKEVAATMRIGLIVPPWLPIPPFAYGAIETIVDVLAQGLRDAGHEVLLFATGDSTCPVPRRWVLPQAAVDRMGPMAVLPELRHVIHAYEAVQGSHIVHDHTFIGPVYAERFDRLPVVTTNHGPFDDEGLSDLYRIIGDRVPVIAISRAQARRTTNVPIARVIHHGLNADDFPFGKGDGGYVLFLGRMNPEKGAKRAARVAEKTGARLLIAAKMREPLERAYFEEEVQPLLSDRIEFLGEVNARRKRELLANARVLLNPIRWPEPFGLVMIEALACGTPVLSFPEGAAAEIVEHGVTGFLCDDEEDMAARLDEVECLDRRACRAAVEGHFSAKRMVAEHVELFEQVLSSERSRG